MKPKIPKGWRKMRQGEIIRKGDKFLCMGSWIKWVLAVGEPLFDVPHSPSIRRIAKKGGKRK